MTETSTRCNESSGSTDSADWTDVTEIVCTTSTITTTNITMRQTTCKVDTVEHVTVRSVRSEIIDASAVLAFADALNKADAPGQTIVHGHRSDAGHLIQLSADWEYDLEPLDPAEHPPMSIAV